MKFSKDKILNGSRKVILTQTSSMLQSRVEVGEILFFP